jgi:hypothetical protein
VCPVTPGEKENIYINRRIVLDDGRNESDTVAKDVLPGRNYSIEGLEESMPTD